MQKEQGTRLHLPLLVQERERRRVICHVCSKHNHVDYAYIESYSVHSGVYCMYSTSTYFCISFGIRRCVRGAEEEDEERARVFCAFCLSPFCCFLSALEQRIYRYETANSFLMFLIFGLETN